VSLAVLYAGFTETVRIQRYRGQQKELSAKVGAAELHVLAQRRDGHRIVTHLFIHEWQNRQRSTRHQPMESHSAAMVEFLC
jgi:hypothetical protein